MNKKLTKINNRQEVTNPKLNKVLDLCLHLKMFKIDS